MKILVTGGSGFIGTNFIKFFLDKYDYKIVNLDKLTYGQDNLKGYNTKNTNLLEETFVIEFLSTN